MNTENELQKHPGIRKLIAQNWLSAYSWVLIVNAIYILLFFLIMIIFN